MPTPRWEWAENPVLARAVTAARGRRLRTRPAPRSSSGSYRRPPGHQLIGLGAYPSGRPLDGGRVVELDQALLMQILDLEESLDRPSTVGTFRANNVAKSCSSPCLA